MVRGFINQKSAFSMIELMVAIVLASMVIIGGVWSLNKFRGVLSLDRIKNDLHRTHQNFQTILRNDLLSAVRARDTNLTALTGVASGLTTPPDPESRRDILKIIRVPYSLASLPISFDPPPTTGTPTNGIIISKDPSPAEFGRTMGGIVLDSLISKSYFNLVTPQGSIIVKKAAVTQNANLIRITVSQPTDFAVSRFSGVGARIEPTELIQYFINDRQELIREGDDGKQMILAKKATGLKILYGFDQDRPKELPKLCKPPANALYRDIRDPEYLALCPGTTPALAAKQITWNDLSRLSVEVKYLSEAEIPAGQRVTAGGGFINEANHLAYTAVISGRPYSGGFGTTLAAGESVECNPGIPSNWCTEECRGRYHNTDSTKDDWIGHDLDDPRGGCDCLRNHVSGRIEDPSYFMQAERWYNFGTNDARKNRARACFQAYGGCAGLGSKVNIFHYPIGTTACYQNPSWVDSTTGQVNTVAMNAYFESVLAGNSQAENQLACTNVMNTIGYGQMDFATSMTLAAAGLPSSSSSNQVYTVGCGCFSPGTPSGDTSYGPLCNLEIANGGTGSPRCPMNMDFSANDSGNTNNPQTGALERVAGPTYLLKPATASPTQLSGGLSQTEAGVCACLRSLPPGTPGVDLNTSAYSLITMDFRQPRDFDDPATGHLRSGGPNGLPLDGGSPWPADGKIPCSVPEKAAPMTYGSVQSLSAKYNGSDGAIHTVNCADFVVARRWGSINACVSGGFSGDALSRYNQANCGTYGDQPHFIMQEEIAVMRYFNQNGRSANPINMCSGSGTTGGTGSGTTGGTTGSGGGMGGI